MTENLNILAGHKQLVLSERQSDLELLQQFEELRQVALWETFGLKQELFHHGALDDSFGMLPGAPTALQRQLLHRHREHLPDTSDTNTWLHLSFNTGLLC